MIEAASAFGSRGFAEQFLGVVASAMPLSGCCFYRVNDGRQVIDHQLFNLLPYWEQRYYHRFCRIDPLHPGRVTQRLQRLQTLTRETAGQDDGGIEYYEQFLRPQNTAFQTELYFWMGSRIVAGASLLRSATHGAFSEQNIIFLDKLVEFTGSNFVAEEDDSPTWQGLSGMTPREREIAFLVGEAISNKEIGRRLDIELPTVKAHVSRVLAKAGARSRAEFIKKLQWR
jgi:DNA-binding CsgD family transcriptional regulator